MIRRSLLKSMALVALLVTAPLASAQLAANADFAPILPPQPGGTNGQIEVIEFFSFGCPHCADFDPLLNEWRKKQGADVVFRRIPISFGRPEWAALGRLAITLEAMKLSDKLDLKVFDAIHKDQVPLWQEGPRNAWLAKQGVDVAAFAKTWRSFGVDSAVRRAEQLATSYKVASVPMLAIDGRFSPRAGEFDALLKSTDKIISRLRAEKASAKAAK